MNGTTVKQRKRGRPAGKRRVPLSLDERRARNTQYERERRGEIAEAMAQLAESAGCATNLSNTELLATVLIYLQRATERIPSCDITKLRQINDNLAFQIETLERRLVEEPDMTYTNTDDKSCDGIAMHSHDNGRDKKRIKLELGVEPEERSGPGTEPHFHYGVNLETEYVHEDAANFENLGDLEILDVTVNIEEQGLMCHSSKTIEEFILDYL